MKSTGDALAQVRKTFEIEAHEIQTLFARMAVLQNHHLKHHQELMQQLLAHHHEQFEISLAHIWESSGCNSKEETAQKLHPMKRPPSIPRNIDSAIDNWEQTCKFDGEMSDGRANPVVNASALKSSLEELHLMKPAVRIEALATTHDHYQPMVRIETSATSSHEVSQPRVRIETSTATSHKPSVHSPTTKFSHETSTETRRNSKVRAEDKQAVYKSYTAMAHQVEMNSGLWPLLTTIGLSPNTIRKAFAHLDKKRLKCSVLDKIICSYTFGAITIFFIVSNAFFVGLVLDQDTDRMLQRYEEQGDLADYRAPSWVILADLSFCIFFFTELVMRMLVEECQFWTGPDWQWNLLDTTVVISCILELSFENSSVNITALRALRMFRAARIVRVLRSFRALRVTLLSIISSLLPFLWAFLFLLLSLFIFAVVLQQAVNNYLADAGPDDDAIVGVRTFFHSFSMTMLSLFMAITGGVDWWEIQETLLHISVGYALFFVFYMSAMVLGVMNIITGIFVEAAHNISSRDRDLIAQAEAERSAEYMKILTNCFVALDKEGRGFITVEDVKEYMHDGEMKALFALLEIDISKPEVMFNLFDVDDNGSLEIDEFVMGCMGMKGMAKAIDQEALVRENKKIVKRLMRFARSTQKKMDQMEERIENLAMPTPAGSRFGTLTAAISEIQKLGIKVTDGSPRNIEVPERLEPGQIYLGI